MLSDPSHMSSDASPRASKRQRTEDVALPTVKKHQRLWFDDGNIILVASDALGFRLHRGILSLHSTVFRDMLSLPSNAQDNEMLEECPVVRLQECGDDLKLFFTLLYDGAKHSFFDKETDHKFDDLRAMTNLSFKYGVKHIQTTALEELRHLYPLDFAHYSACFTSNDSPLDLHCISAVNLARRFNIPNLLPVALYECSVTDLPMLLNAVDYGPSGSEQLSQADLRRCLAAVAKLEAANSLRMAVFHNFCPNPQLCTNPAGTTCIAVIKLLLSGLCTAPFIFHSQWMFRPLETDIDRAIATPGVRAKALCDACKTALLEKYKEVQEKIWNELPDMFNVEPWDVKDRS